MPSLAACRCPFRLMRRCFLGEWICLLVTERFRQVWRCHQFDYSIYIPFCVHWHGGQWLRRLVNCIVLRNYSLVLYELKIGPHQVLQIRARVDLEAIAMKEYSAIPKAPALLEPHHQIVLVSYLGHSLGGGLIPLRKSSRNNLPPKPTGLRCFSVISRTLVGRGGLSLCGNPVGIIYRPSRLGWDVLVSYLGHSLGNLTPAQESYPSVCSIAPVDWTQVLSEYLNSQP